MTEKPQQTSPPRQTLYAAFALAASGLFAMIGGIVLLGNKDWIRSNRRDALNKIIKDSSKSAKDKASASKSLRDHDLSNYVSTQVKASIIGAIITLLLCAFLAYSVYRGRHWSRWGVIGVWVLSTVTGSFISLFVLLGFASSSTVPGSLRVPIVAAGIAYVGALVLVNLRPSVAYFALSRPERAAGRPARGGLFGPRPPRGAAPARGARAATTVAAPEKNVSLTKGAASDRPRTKQRASSDAVAKGAELARTRAKAASKSRRSGS